MWRAWPAGASLVLDGLCQINGGAHTFPSLAKNEIKEQRESCEKKASMPSRPLSFSLFFSQSWRRQRGQQARRRRQGFQVTPVQAQLRPPGRGEGPGPPPRPSRTHPASAGPDVGQGWVRRRRRDSGRASNGRGGAARRGCGRPRPRRAQQVKGRGLAAVAAQDHNRNSPPSAGGATMAATPRTRVPDVHASPVDRGVMPRGGSGGASSVAACQGRK
jgi:hypothetical protein